MASTFGNPNPDKDYLARRYQVGQQSFSTGNKSYNGTNPSPHVGGGIDKSGYRLRDQKAKAKKDFLMNQLRSGGF